MIGGVFGGFSALDWLIAWRHLRSGDDRPAWVRPLLLTAIYLIVVGGALALYAGSLSSAPVPVIDGPFGPIEPEITPTPVEQWYGTFGALTLILGVMALVFGLLARFFNLLPTVITMSVLLGCMALVVVLSLMSGLEGDLRDKILNQKAHIRVSRKDGKPFADYTELADALAVGEGIAGASPYLEGEIMVRSGLNRQGALLSGIVPSRQTKVSNLPELIEEGDYDYLEHPEDIPSAGPFGLLEPGTPYRLRHLEEERKKNSKVERVGDEERKIDISLGAAGAGLQLKNKLPRPLPSVGELPGPAVAPAGFSGGEDEGWEDPSEELGARKAAPRDPAPSLSDSVRAGLLSDIPSVGERLAAPPQDAPPPDDGWEDPTVELGSPRSDAGSELPPPPLDTPGAQPFGAEQALEIEGARRPILIGRELSMELGVRLGASVQLITPIGRITPAGQVPGQLAARVGGVFYSGMYEYDRKNVYAPLATVQRFLLTGDKVSGVEIKLVDVEAIDAGKAEVERIVAGLGRLSEEDDLIVEDWRDLNRNLFSAMFLEKVAMFIALLFVVLVASFGILASNLMSVMEKSKEIAILKAMGTPDSGIMRVFVAEGLCVGLLGSFGGIGMGLGLCWALDRYGLPLNENVYYIEKLPVVVNPFEVALVGIAALVIVCLSSIYPALVASRLRPVDALRQGER
ncbi:MAG: ABC transporter permease [Nannocystaceae bacterium]|nr:ABC transporter permease [Nannocystaceae bacterium]